MSLSGCLTNNLTSTDKLSLIENVDTESNGDAGDEGSSSIITLSQVVRTNSNAASELDLVGDGSGSMGTFCASEDGDDNGDGTSGCTCEFSYTRRQVSAEVIEVDASYR